MKAQWITGLVAAIVAVGAFGSAGQAAVITYDVVVVGSAQVDAGDSNVVFEVYADIQNDDSDNTNDGFMMGFLNIVDTGSLLGDLSFNLDMWTKYTGSSTGKVQDLDADGDNDLGSLDSNIPGDYVNPIALIFPGSVPMGGGDYVKLGWGTWHMTDASPAVGETTDMEIVPLVLSDPLPHRVKSDGNDVSLDGSGPLVDTTSFRITYVPEPMTLGLLAVGGLALLRRRRR